VESFAALTPTLPPATHTQSYALGERQILLVEPSTPYPEERVEWLAWARGLASAGRELVAIFVTHHHADHVGGAEALSQELGLPLWAHAETAKRMARVTVARSLVEGDAVVLDGPAPSRWEVLHTPGHAPGHLCLLERERGTLVVGDMVASVGTILIEPKDGDMAEYLASLQRLAELEAEVALPAHGAPIPSPSRLFRAYGAHRLMRESVVADALKSSGGGSLDELVSIAYADTSSLLWPLAKLSLEAHLVKLVREGRAATDGERWRSSEVDPSTTR
jgi:glyoxylase-like metal-dependent hydrolase (beta-lactamase superfamily II)